MEREVGYNVFLPPSYDSSIAMRFPVVYFLHGSSGDESSDTGLVHLVRSELEGGHIAETIYVFVNGGAFSFFRDDPVRNVFPETHIVQELIPAVDARYRTIAKREGRALFGFSMGGSGAVRLALKYPNEFCAAASISGSLSREPAENEAGRPSNRDNMFELASMNRATLIGGTQFYFSVGTAERFHAAHPPFMKHLSALGIEFVYREAPGLGHNLGASLDLFGIEIVRFLSSQCRHA